MGLLHDDKGCVSMMRLTAFIGTVVGVVAGIVAMFKLNPAAVGMAAICASLATTAMGLKWAQKREEVKRT